MEERRKLISIRSFKDQPLKVKMTLLIGLFTILALANYLIITRHNEGQKSDADVINLAGRQRMLSQKIAFLSEKVVRGEKAYAKEDLRRAMKLAHVSLQVLKDGGNFPGSDALKIIPPTPMDVKGTLLVTEEIWNEYRENIEVIVSQDLVIDSLIYGLRQDSSTHQAVKEVIDSKKIRNPEVLLAIAAIERDAHLMLVTFNELVTAYVEKSDEKQAALENLLLATLFLSVIMVYLTLRLLNRYIVSPIINIGDIINQLAEGNSKIKIQSGSKDEIGEAVNNLIKLDENLQNASEFAQQIGNGNFNSPYEVIGDNDTLGLSLVDMRQRLVCVSEEDRKRNWVSEGMAKFSDILRQNQQDLYALSDDILAYLINYLEANQGAIYLVNDSEEEDYLEQVAIYAWGKKRYIKNRLEVGEGVAGQVWRERLSIYLTEIPDGYVQITSGLGHANPSSILVVPLQLNEEIYGIIEVASLKKYESYQIEFIEKLAENIASTISASQASHKTRVLLDQTQRQSELTKAQEEEMRQTMEEVQATTEEMERKEQQYIKQIEKLEAAIENSQISKEEKALIFKIEEDEKLNQTEFEPRHKMTG